MSYANNPEVIANARNVNADGDELFHGDKVCGIQAYSPKWQKKWPNGCVQLDLREFTKNANLVIEFDAEQLMQAITRVMLNRDE